MTEQESPYKTKLFSSDQVGIWGKEKKANEASKQEKAKTRELSSE